MIMNASELATKMLEWEKARRDLDLLESEIKEAVLEIGKTQTVGNVRASFSNGRRIYDYEGAARKADAPDDVVDVYSKTVTDWKKVCEVMQILDDVQVIKKTDPTVSIKLVE